MKTNSLLTAIVLSLLIPFTANAQDNPRNSVFSPYKSGASPLFGKDIVIYDDPTVNQENLAICTAFNGWFCSINLSETRRSVCHYPAINRQWIDMGG